jgi:hypothetical protein
MHERHLPHYVVTPGHPGGGRPRHLSLSPAYGAPTDPR